MTERIDERYAELDTWTLEQTLEALLESNLNAVSAVQAVLGDLTRAAEGIVKRLKAGGRLVYVGAGTSGRLALQDAAELPPTFGFERTLVLLAGGGSGERASSGGCRGRRSSGTASRRECRD